MRLCFRARTRNLSRSRTRCRLVPLQRLQVLLP